MQKSNNRYFKRLYVPLFHVTGFIRISEVKVWRNKKLFNVHEGYFLILKIALNLS